MEISSGWLEYSTNLLISGHLSIRICTHIQNKQFLPEILDQKIKLEIKKFYTIFSDRKEKQDIKHQVLSGLLHSIK